MSEGNNNNVNTQSRESSKYSKKDTGHSLTRRFISEDMSFPITQASHTVAQPSQMGVQVGTVEYQNVDFSVPR